MNTLTISIATEDDINQIVQLVNSAYRGESSKKGWTTEADLLEGIRIDPQSLLRLISSTDSIVLKCIKDDTIIGCVNLQTRSRQLYLGMLTVAPNLQGGGIGKQLLNAAEQFAKSNQLESIEMTVISVRSELISWYERNGYENTGETKPFPELDPSFGRAKQALEFFVLRKPMR